MPRERDPGDGLKQTALARRNRATCSECGEVIESEQDNTRVVRWGFWDEEKQWFQGSAHQEHYCPACWRYEFAREAAAHYEVTDVDRFWDILEAANGQLVADCKPMFISGRPWLRVVDGDLQVLGAHMYRGDQPDVVKSRVERHEDVDREWFNDTFADVVEGSNPPAVALLKPAEETPFDRYESLHHHQMTLDEGEDDA